MERQEWLKHMICFQAQCRGYLIRKEMKSVQADFEEVVKELEGCLDHVNWRRSLIPIPYFTDNGCALSKYRWPKIQTKGHPELAEKLKEQIGESHESLSETVVLVPKRDVQPYSSPQRDCSSPPLPPSDDRGGVWRSKALEMSCNRLQQKGHQRHSRVQDVARTPEALKQHRNTLAMELLWIQQAIVSRKKYLTLRQKMGVV